MGPDDVHSTGKPASKYDNVYATVLRPARPIVNTDGCAQRPYTIMQTTYSDSSLEASKTPWLSTSIKD